MQGKTIQLHLSKRVQRAQMLNHIAPGLILLLSGISYFSGDESEHIRFPLLSIAAGTAVILTIIYEFRFAKQTERKLLDWVDILAGIVLVIDGINHFKTTKFFQPSLLYILLGLFTTGKGIFHSRLPHIRRCTADENEFSIRTSPFRKFSCEWKRIKNINYESTHVRILTSDDVNHSISLRKIENRNDVKALLNEFAKVKNIPVNELSS